MKKLINQVDKIVDEMLNGMVDAYPQYVKRLEGFEVLVRAKGPSEKVALVSGGGSGHEPSHGGYVGKGMLDGAVAGEVFTSPTPDQVFEAIEAVNGRKGVLLVIKNYTGDVMNFEMAADMARDEGIEVEQVITGKTAREKLLRKAVKPFEDYFDYVFIDCPPQLGILTTNALVASDHVIIPSKAEYLSYRGIRALKRTIKNVVEEELNSSLVLDGFIITMFEKNINDQKDMLEQFRKEDTVLGIVKKSADAYRNILDGGPVVISNPKSDVAVAYTEIAEKL